MPVLALVALFIAVPLAELYVIFKAADDWIGPAWTILLLAADSVIGALLLRSQGRTAWRRFNEVLSAGRMPHREVQDGVLVIFGGALLVTPGFITDAVGLMLLIPPTRALVRRLGMRAIRKRVERRVTAARSGVDADGAATGAAFDVEGTATEYESPPGRLPR